MIYLCRRYQYDSRARKRERERKRKKKRKKTERKEEEEGEERRGGERRKKEEEEKGKKKEEEEERRKMATAKLGDWGSKGGRCPHHPTGTGFVCLEANHFLATAKKWKACHERLMCLDRAMDGDVDDLWVLEHPSPTPDLSSMLALPPVAGWICTPIADFQSDTAKLMKATLGLAQHHLRWEKEEGAALSQATPGAKPYQVIKHAEIEMDMICIE